MVSILGFDDSYNILYLFFIILQLIGSFEGCVRTSDLLLIRKTFFLCNCLFFSTNKLISD